MYEIRRDFDLIQINGYTFSSFGQPRGLPEGLTLTEYEGDVGMYLVQFKAPMTPTWWRALEATGEVVAYYPQNTYLIRAARGDMPVLRLVNGVQHVSLFQPAYKVRRSLLTRDEVVEVDVEFDGDQDMEVARTALRGILDEEVSTDRIGRFAYSRLTRTSHHRASILRRPEVTWVEPALQIEFSGERTACITAGKYDEDEGIKPDRTRYQVGYQAWLEDKGFCLPTTELGEEKPCMLYWPKVGVIDSGLDVTRCPEANYIEATGVCDPPDPSNELHWDLNHRANNASICNQMFGSGESMDPMSECPDWIVGGTFHCAGPLGARYCHDSGEQTYDFSDKAYDGDGHGTAVAAIIAGDYFSLGDGDDQGYQAAATDSDPDEGFYRGVGIAPSARINVGKMGDFDEQNPLSITANDFAFLVRRMVLDDTRFFNCSWNLHSPYQGRDEEEYTLFSKIADLLVRDGDYGIGSDNREITMVFSAGNGGPPVDGMFALSPGNAKNVISVGANNGWDSPYPDEGEELCPIRDPAGKYKIENIGRFSLRSYVYETGDGEALPRYKPDLVASGTHLAAAASRHYDPDQTPAYVYYGCFQGTSAAAPAVTASAVLAETWYWNRIIDPQHRKRASPAMIKAMLVAHADSLHGGIDVADQIDEDQYATLNHAPSLPQGWGRVNLNELFQEQVDGQNKVPVLVYDQHTHLFTESGEVWQTSVDVADDGEDLIIVMVYTDLHAEPSEELESLTVNDLDLKVGQFEFFDPHVFYGNRFETDTEYSRDYPLLTLNDQVPDRHNTVEVVRIPGDVLDGPVSIQVRAYDVAMEAVPDPDSNSPNQDFALYIFNAELH